MTSMGCTFSPVKMNQTQGRGERISQWGPGDALNWYRNNCIAFEKYLTQSYHIWKLLEMQFEIKQYKVFHSLHANYSQFKFGFFVNHYILWSLYLWHATCLWMTDILLWITTILKNINGYPATIHYALFFFYFSWRMCNQFMYWLKFT